MTTEPTPSNAKTSSWLTWVLVAAASLALLGVLVWAFWTAPNHWAEVEQAQNYLDMGRPDLAFQAVSEIRDEAPGAAEALAIAAQALLSTGNLSLARKTLDRSLALNPNQAEPAKMLAAIYLASGDGPRGIDLLKSASRLEPRDFRPWLAMGKVYHDLGELSLSADSYAQALKRNPPAREVVPCRVGLIRSLLDSNRQPEAAVELQSALRLHPQNSEILGLAAQLASQEGRKQEALELADKALATSPDNFDALLVRSRLDSLAGNLEPALADLEHALQINPNHLGALQRLMQVQQQLGHAQEAEATRQRFQASTDRITLMDRITKEINARPEDPEPRWRMGQAALEGNMTTLAYQCFQAALDLNPNYRPALQGLEQLKANQPPPPPPVGQAPPDSPHEESHSP